MSAASQGSLGGGAGGCEVTPGGGGTVWVSLGGVCVHMRVCLRRPHGGWLSAQQAVWQMVEPRPPRGCEPPGAAAFSALTSPMSVSGEPAGKGQRQGHQGADATAAGSVPTGWPWLGSNSSQKQTGTGLWSRDPLRLLDLRLGASGCPVAKPHSADLSLKQPPPVAPETQTGPGESSSAAARL